jgi:hypothetical protein
MSGIKTAQNSHCPCGIVRKSDVFIPITPEAKERGRKVNVTAVRTSIALVLSSPRTLIEFLVY